MLVGGVKLFYLNFFFDEKILELMYGLYYDNVNVYIIIYYYRF